MLLGNDWGFSLFEIYFRHKDCWGIDLFVIEKNVTRYSLLGIFRFGRGTIFHVFFMVFEYIKGDKWEPVKYAEILKKMKK